nr:DNA helicase [Tanacetum cinerariifolium]
MGLPKKPALSCIPTPCDKLAESHGESSSLNHQGNQLRLPYMHADTENVWSKKDASAKSFIMQPSVHGDGINKHISPCMLTTSQNKSRGTMIINRTDTVNEDKNFHASNMWQLNVSHNTLSIVPSSKEMEKRGNRKETNFATHMSQKWHRQQVATTSQNKTSRHDTGSSNNRKITSRIQLKDQQCECEKISTSGSGESAIYNRCCNGGQVVLRKPPEYPQYIKNLFADPHFMENIRAYNQMFNMTSLGAKVDTSIKNGRGPYVFRISDQIYHWIGSMCPQEGDMPRFLQLYIYDTNNEVQNRMAHFGGEEQSGLKREIVEGLIDFLDNHNALYVVTAYCVVEQTRLDYIRQTQNDIRNEYLLGIYDAILRGDRNGSDLGTRTILSASFTGGPRYMYAYYLDALAICQLTTADRADIVDRIFEQKVCYYIKFVRNTKIFGHITAVLYTIEFQKRGLPHCHLLLWVSFSTKVQQDIDVDKYISAELPHPVQDPEAYRVISELMIHGPCGYGNKNASCMKDGNKCNRNFPKPYCDATYIDKDGFVHYRRRHNDIDTESQQRRCRQNKPVIGRLTYIHPNVGDLFYQRLLLFHQKGCRSFREIRTVNGIVFQTNRVACEALTLIGGNQEWKFWKDMSHDIPRRLSRLLEIPEVEQNKTEMQAGALFKLEAILNSNSRTLKEFGLPMPDEAPMNDRRCFEAFDRCLRDILDNPQTVFGGKTIILGGDFRQTLPVKKKASKLEIIDASITASYLWTKFKLYSLHQNMWLSRPYITDDERNKIQRFSSWLLDIGDGNIGDADEIDVENSSTVEIPNELCIQDGDTAITDSISSIYDTQTFERPTAEHLQKKVIVCPKNKTTYIINRQVLSALNEREHVYLSSDDATLHGNDGRETELLYPNEYLNSLNFAGLPPHRLELKVGAPIILLLNLNLTGGMPSSSTQLNHSKYKANHVAQMKKKNAKPLLYTITSQCEPTTLSDVLKALENTTYVFQYRFGQKAKPGHSNFSLDAVFSASPQPLLHLPLPESATSPLQELLEQTSSAVTPLPTELDPHQSTKDLAKGFDTSSKTTNKTAKRKLFEDTEG